MQTEGKNPVSCVLPGLYAAWVEKPRVVARNGVAPSLLTTEDLVDGKVVSALNSSVLEDIASAALQPPAEKTTMQAPHKFLASPLHLYLTASNLPGIQYVVHGSGPTDVYRMVNHGDRLHFCINDIGSDARVASDWAGADTSNTALALASLRADPPTWQVLADASLAMAAFPIGLSARAWVSPQSVYQGRWFPAPQFGTAKIGPQWPTWLPSMPDAFSFVSVDGGMINNDPFDFARYTLLQDSRVRPVRRIHRPRRTRTGP